MDLLAICSQTAPAFGVFQTHRTGGGRHGIMRYLKPLPFDLEVAWIGRRRP